MSQKPVVVWFRDDLRLSDHPALATACDTGAPVICLFVLEDDTPGRRNTGGAARWWLARSLRSLDSGLRSLGNRLILRAGRAADVVPAVLAETGATRLVWNRRYDAGGIAVDSAIKASLKDSGIVATSFPGNLLREPWEVTSAAGDPMRVFTPFWRAHQKLGSLRLPLRAPGGIPTPDAPVDSDSLDDWGLEPRKPNWAAGFADQWSPGEAGAQAALDAFVAGPLAGYSDDRNRPDLASTSRLSPHLRFGEISPLQIWHRAQMAAGMEGGRDLSLIHISEPTRPY